MKRTRGVSARQAMRRYSVSPLAELDTLECFLRAAQRDGDAERVALLTVKADALRAKLAAQWR